MVTREKAVCGVPMNTVSLHTVARGSDGQKTVSQWRTFAKRFNIGDLFYRPVELCLRQLRLSEEVDGCKTVMEVLAYQSRCLPE